MVTRHDFIATRLGTVEVLVIDHGNFGTMQVRLGGNVIESHTAPYASELHDMADKAMQGACQVMAYMEAK